MLFLIFLLQDFFLFLRKGNNSKSAFFKTQQAQRKLSLYHRGYPRYRGNQPTVFSGAGVCIFLCRRLNEESYLNKVFLNRILQKCYKCNVFNKSLK